MNNKIKPFLIYGGLFLAGGLASLGVNALKSGKEKVEATTTEYVTEYVAEPEATTEEVTYDVNYEVEAIVENSYATYQTYYDTMGYTQDDIRTTILVLGDMTEGLTKDDVIDSCRMVKDILASDNLAQKIDNINHGSEVDCDLMTLPKVSEFILEKDSEIKPIVERVEANRDLIVSAIQGTGDYKSVLDQFNNDTVDMCYDTWNEDQGLDVTNLSNEGSLFLVSAAKWSLLNLAGTLNSGEIYIEGSKIDNITNEPQKVKVNYTAEEQDIENQIMQADLLGLQVSQEIIDEYANFRSTKKIVQFEIAMCNYQHSLELKVEELNNANTYNYNLN